MDLIVRPHTQKALIGLRHGAHMRRYCFQCPMASPEPRAAPGRVLSQIGTVSASEQRQQLFGTAAGADAPAGHDSPAQQQARGELGSATEAVTGPEEGKKGL